MKNIVRLWALLSAGLIGVACVGDESPSAEPQPEVPTEIDNAPPKAAAGENRTVIVGSEVELNGSKSSDPDGDSLTLTWTIVSKPSGSEAALHDTASRTPRFVVDKAGDYDIELRVSDGVASATDTVTVRGNTAPIADAGASLTSPLGEEVVLNGSASSDPDGDPLTYAWAFISRPSESESALANATSATPSFSPDALGGYTIELTVSDGHAEARARVNVDVTPEGGAGSILYVSKTGDDTAAGTLSAPLGTVGEALERILASNGTLKRAVLAPGTYEEAFDRTIPRAVEIVGPAEGSPAALLKGAGSLFHVKGATGSLSLLRVDLESGGEALTVFENGSLNLTQVGCTAKRCVVGVDDDDEQRPSGTVQVVQSKLSGSANASGGIVLGNGTLTIDDSTVEEFKTGVGLFGASVLMRKTTVRKSATYGLSSIYVSSGDLRVEDSSFEQNATGIYLYSSPNAVVKNTTIKQSSTHGVEFQGGSGALLEDVTIENGGGVGVYVDTTGASTVRLRGTSVLNHYSHALHVKGKASKVDLGTVAQAGNNILNNNIAMGFPVVAWSIFDDRPAGATGAITLSQTKLDKTGSAFPAGTYTGPHAPANDGRLRIVNDGNVVVAH